MKEADMVVTAHVHIEIPEGVEPAAAMMKVTQLIEKELHEAAKTQAFDTDGIFVQVGKVIGAGIPR